MTDFSYFFISCLLFLYKKILYSLSTILQPLIKHSAEAFFLEKGIKLTNGKNPWDVQVKSNNFYKRVGIESSLGLGESYMDGEWECQDLPELIFRLFRNGDIVFDKSPINRWFTKTLLKGFNLQTRETSIQVAEEHYDIGNDIYEAMLGSNTMNYTMGYWRGLKHDPENLQQAQLNKMSLIARKLKLKPKMKVLDIGSGYGTLCKYLAENYDVYAVGVNISKEQVKYAREICSKMDQVEFRLCDYRDLDPNEKFDRIVSVGMFEHVGQHNYREYFEVAQRCLKDDGLFLLHTIGVGHTDMIVVDPWIHKYIFPNGQLPYSKDILNYTEGLFQIEDWSNLGFNYYPTLNAWKKNFIDAWPKLRKERLKRKAKGGMDPDKFYRMWIFYLSLAAGTFKARKFNVWQICLSKNGILEGYETEI